MTWHDLTWYTSKKRVYLDAPTDHIFLCMSIPIKCWCNSCFMKWWCCGWCRDGWGCRGGTFSTDSLCSIACCSMMCMRTCMLSRCEGTTHRYMQSKHTRTAHMCHLTHWFCHITVCGTLVVVVVVVAIVFSYVTYVDEMWWLIDHHGLYEVEAWCEMRWWDPRENDNQTLHQPIHTSA